MLRAADAAQGIFRFKLCLRVRHTRAADDGGRAHRTDPGARTKQKETATRHGGGIAILLQCSSVILYMDKDMLASRSIL